MHVAMVTVPCIVVLPASATTLISSSGGCVVIFCFHSKEMGLSSSKQGAVGGPGRSVREMRMKG